LIYWIVQYVCLKMCMPGDRELCRETVMTPETTGMLETAEFSKSRHVNDGRDASNIRTRGYAALRFAAGSLSASLSL
jgi:hypothetical protein